MKNSKRGFVCMAHGTVLSSSQYASTKVKLEKIKDVTDASVIGSIIYAMSCTRPELAYSMRMRSNFQHNPWETH